MPTVRLKHLILLADLDQPFGGSGAKPRSSIYEGAGQFPFSQGQPQSKKVKQLVSWAANTILKIDSLFWQKWYDALSAPCA
jgi:hypothetical protein